MEYIITFKSTNFAIKAEQCLLEQKINVSVLPLPSQIRAGCGICLRVSHEEINAALAVLSAKQIDCDLYSRVQSGNRFSYVNANRPRPETQSVSTLPQGEGNCYRSAFMQPKLPSLLDNCTSGGCGAKISPGALSTLLRGLPVFHDENLIVGYDSSDDAAVYRLDDTRSIVTTVDFFPPMVNDPETFGRIAAANALSDVYAMGGRPITALNLVCFPQSMDMEILQSILAGSAAKVMEASAVLAGGHSIYDKEPKYGLAVTGLVENNRVIRNNTPELGYKLILTKPLGTGIIMAALRGEVASDSAVAKATASMERLNRYAAEKMREFKVSACTDITGFGLLAHMLEMAADRVSIAIYSSEIPYFEAAYQYADEFLITAAGQRNRNHLAGKADVSSLPFAMQELLFDPQTSGGLLICVAPEQANDLLAAIQVDDPAARIIGEVVKREDAVIIT